MEFAIDRLNKERYGRPKAVDKKSKKTKCTHPSWIVNGDGHTQTWFNCVKCGEYSWIAPWILNPPKEYYD